VGFLLGSFQTNTDILTVLDFRWVNYCNLAKACSNTRFVYHYKVDEQITRINMDNPDEGTREKMPDSTT
jgi:hypothetical protein